MIQTNICIGKYWNIQIFVLENIEIYKYSSHPDGNANINSNLLVFCLLFKQGSFGVCRLTLVHVGSNTG